MMKLFIDTSAFVALTDKSVYYHEAASLFITSLAHPVKLITSDFILDETITRISTSIGPTLACTFAESIIKSKIHEIVYVDYNILIDSLKLLKKYSDKKLSFTDVTSFAIMKRLKLTDAFSFDRDFLKAGFHILPGYGKAL